MNFTTEGTPKSNNADSEVYIGVLLAVSSSLFIGSSFIFKKKSLIKLGHDGGVRAGNGGFGYLKDLLWWIGLLFMGIGELANFAAYAFAPASLVTPLGALSVLVSSLLAAKYLDEKFNLIRQMGCVLCILGSTVIILHAPKEDEIKSVEELLQRFQDSGFSNYLAVMVAICLIIFCYLGPLYGRTYVLVYVTFCSAVGSITVMACKGLALAIRYRSVSPGPENGILLAALLILVALCVCLQMNYLNKSLDLFNASVVTPIYYVLFTSLVMTASAILYDEWKNMLTSDVLACICGFFITVIALYMISSFKDINVYINNTTNESRMYGSIATF